MEENQKCPVEGCNCARYRTSKPGHGHVSAQFGAVCAEDPSTRRARQIEVVTHGAITSDDLNRLVAGQEHAEKLAAVDAVNGAFDDAQAYFKALDGAQIPATAVVRFLELLKSKMKVAL